MISKLSKCIIFFLIFEFLFVGINYSQTKIFINPQLGKYTLGHVILPRSTDLNRMKTDRFTRATGYINGIRVGGGVDNNISRRIEHIIPKHPIPVRNIVALETQLFSDYNNLVSNRNLGIVTLFSESNRLYLHMRTKDMNKLYWMEHINDKKPVEMLEAIWSMTDLKRNLESTNSILINGSREMIDRYNFQKLLPDKFIVFSDNLGNKDRFENLETIYNRKTNLNELGIFNFFPQNMKQLRSMEPTWKGANEITKEDINRVNQSLNSTLSDNKALMGKIYPEPINGTSLWFRTLNIFKRENIKGKLLANIPKAKNILIIFAHGTSNTLCLPNGEIITSEEIKSLKLINKPLVILLSCEASKSNKKQNIQNIAQSFKTAGACGVISTSEILPVTTANRLIGLYIKNAKNGHESLLNGLQSLFEELKKENSSNIFQFYVEVDEQKIYLLTVIDRIYNS